MVSYLAWLNPVGKILNINFVGNFLIIQIIYVKLKVFLLYLNFFRDNLKKNSHFVPFKCNNKECIEYIN